MTTIGPAGTVALQMLSEQAAPIGRQAVQNAASVKLIAVNNGVQATNSVAPLAGKPKFASAIFDASAPDVTKMKLDLFRRTGEKLGVHEDDFDSFADYAMVLKDAVTQLKISPNAEMIIRRVEKDLGLDKLGVSLDTVIDALTDPASGANQTLTDALRKQMAEHDDGRTGRPAHVQSDDLGLYRVV